MRRCKVYVNKVFAGILSENDSGKYSFKYDKDYLKDANPPVCIAMPTDRELYTSDTLFPFFFNLLSEGSNRRFQIKLHHLEENDDFGLLLKTATYDTVGAVTVEEII